MPITVSWTAHAAVILRNNVAQTTGSNLLHGTVDV